MQNVGWPRNSWYVELSTENCTDINCIGVRGGGAGGAAAPPIFRDHGKSGNLCLNSRAI